MDEYINCAIVKVVQESGEYDKMPQTGRACYDGMMVAFDMCIKVIEEIESVNSKT